MSSPPPRAAKRRLEVRIDTEPVPKARPRMGAGGRVYTPQRTHDAEEIIGWHAKAAWKGAPTKEPVRVDVGFVCSTGNLPDLDNLIKTVLDACNRVVWRDDRQVAVIRARRVQGAPPCIDLRVSEI